VSAGVYRDALESVERILERGGDADDVLRGVVAAIEERVPHFAWVGIAFMEEGRLELGPEAGDGDGEELRAVVTFDGVPVAELVVKRTEPADDDQPFLDRVATRVSPYCLVGWDTQGLAWSDVS
jgi:putative methionine-R-sulfoxide reductase with GAF domain